VTEHGYNRVRSARFNGAVFFACAYNRSWISRVLRRMSSLEICGVFDKRSSPCDAP